MTRGRKAKTNVAGPDSRGHKRQSADDEAFAGRTAKAEKATRAKRAKPPALGPLVANLVKLATSSESASKAYAAALGRVRRQGVSLDDVAALILARAVIVEHAIEHHEIDVERALLELGRINRELAELAAAYREQGRSLPDQITFRLQLTAAVPAGAQPTDAPELRTARIGGDVIETE